MEERARTSTRRRGSRAAAALTDREAMRLIRSAMRLVEEAPESLQLRSRFEAEAVSATLRAIPRPLSREATRAIERMARWIIAECADLIEGVPVNDPQRVSAALRAVQERRLAGGKNLRTASPLIELVGSWRESDGILYRDGRAVSIKSTAPRLVRLASGVEVQPLNAPESGRRTAEAALAALAESGAPLRESLLGRRAVATLSRRGLVEIVSVHDGRRTATEAIRMLLNGARRETEIGRGAVGTLIARRWARRLDAAEAAAVLSGSSESSLRDLRRTLRVLTGDAPAIAAPRRRRVSRLAAATNSSGEGVAESALKELRERLIECADGDAADRLLFLECAYWLRQSEARGLMVRDVDLNEPAIRIERQRIESGEVVPVKSRRSRRRIPIIAEDLPRFRAWIEGRDPDEYLVAALLTNQAIRCRRALRTSEVGYRRTIIAADLRHAGISLSRAAGSTADETARIAGHSAEMSERIYDERLERTAPIAALARARG